MSQLVTLDEAKAVAARINETGIGGGVLPYSENNDQSGIYVPSWAPIAPDPNTGPEKFYFFRLRNGCDVICVGALAAIMTCLPASWMGILALEVSRPRMNY